ncbi:MAG: hypothetical protein ACJ79S_20125 [Gemmatimonadaceae bacterium]
MTHPFPCGGTSRRALLRPSPATLAAAAALLATSPALPRLAGALRAQGTADVSAGASVAAPTRAPISPATSSAALPPAMTQEIYVAAFRGSARQWCAGGGADALDDAAAGTKAIAQSSVAEGERAGVERAIDDAHAELERAGGCAALGRATRIVVVDGFEGYPWSARRSEVAPRDRGRRGEYGYTIVTRRTKIGGRGVRRVPAEADFTFTSERDELVRGRYRVTAKRADVAGRWADVERALAGRYPTLRVTHAPGDAAGASDVRTWSTSFTNPDTQALELRMSAVPGGEARDDEWVIVVDFLGYAGR